ncbi:MAG TPA: FAD-dependent oxidoreductase [Thermoplasmata archaeon]|nr:FAD-dependent oxidoreductase [Thermoplasmata archaeon]
MSTIPPAPRKVRLLDSHPETAEARTFRFDRGSPPYEWRAGQNLVMTISGVEGPKGPTYPFTVSSSPTEPGFLAITTFLRDTPFKRRLAALKPGETVDLDGPEGTFVLEPGRPAVMVAGGIGVTPFRSMLRFATDSRLEKPLVLVYSSRTLESIVFRAELDELARRNHAIRVLHTITRPDASDPRWGGRTGRIDGELLREAMRGVRHPLVYVAGPPEFVRAGRKLLADEIRIAADDIRTDEFDGY